MWKKILIISALLFVVSVSVVSAVEESSVYVAGESMPADEAGAGVSTLVLLIGLAAVGGVGGVMLMRDRASKTGS